jgi:hypothetical protein
MLGNSIAESPVGGVPGSAAAGEVLVGADLECAFAIDPSAATLVSADLVCAYAIDPVPAVLVGADLICNYAIRNGGAMAFEPSKARTVTVQANDRAFTVAAPGFWNMNDPKRPKGLKDPGATLDITFDWAPWLADISDSILLYQFTVGGEMAKEGESIDGTKATVFVSGGSLGDASITCRITTASTPARGDERTVVLKIEER